MKNDQHTNGKYSHSVLLIFTNCPCLFGVRVVYYAAADHKNSIQLDPKTDSLQSVM